MPFGSHRALYRYHLIRGASGFVHIVDHTQDFRTPEIMAKYGAGRSEAQHKVARLLNGRHI